MANGWSLSGDNQPLTELTDHHEDVVASLRLYYSAANPSVALRFAAYSPVQLSEELQKRIAETELQTSLMILAALEAAFSVDFTVRCDRKMRDNLSRAFRDIRKERGERVSMQKHILPEWQKHSALPPALISQMGKAFKLRHWLAHGRYWTPSSGAWPDYVAVATLATAIFGTSALLNQ